MLIKFKLYDSNDEPLTFRIESDIDLKLSLDNYLNKLFSI